MQPQGGFSEKMLLEPLMIAMWGEHRTDRKGMMKSHLIECAGVIISLTWARWAKKIKKQGRNLTLWKDRYEEGQKSKLL